jgi:hypothetical protein
MGPREPPPGDTINVQSTVRSSFGTRLARFALAGMVTAGLVLATTPVSASAAAPYGFIGVNAEDVYAGDDAYQERMLSLMQANGITQVRQIWRWAYVEQVRGVLDWSMLDRFTVAAARHDIRVLPLVGGETPWATSRPAGNDERCLFPPADNATFANWMRLVVERYGPGGTLWQQYPELADYALDTWQIWNEPNKSKFWACKTNPKAYVELARVAANAIHAVDPNATIITAGAPREGKPGTYLRKMFKNGAKKVFDAFALHAYKKDADGVLAEVKKARDILADLGAANWELHVTEFGWATGFPPGDHSVGNDETKQGRLIKNTYTKLGAQRKKLKIASVNYYAWRDLPPPTDFGGGPDYWGLHTGFLRLDGTPKPALSALLNASRAIN